MTANPSQALEGSHPGLSCGRATGAVAHVCDLNSNLVLKVREFVRESVTPGKALCPGVTTMAPVYDSMLHYEDANVAFCPKLATMTAEKPRRTLRPRCGAAPRTLARRALGARSCTPVVTSALLCCRSTEFMPDTRYH